MPNLFPFKGIKYNLQHVSNLSDVTTQPYDRISEKQQRDYYAKNSHNFVRLILPLPTEKPNPYAFANQTLNQWLNEGIFHEDREEAIYVYHQTYSLNDRIYTRKGILAMLEISSSSNKKVYPHEETQTKPMMDRLNMLRETKTHFESIMIIYDDPTKRLDQIHNNVSAVKPLINTFDEFDNKHLVWKISDIKKINFVQDAIYSCKAIIADGHHRYKTSCAYFDELKQKNKNLNSFKILATFFNAYDDGIKIRPIHRCIKKEISANSLINMLSNEFAIDVYDQLDDVSVAREFTEDVKIEGLSKLAFGFISSSQNKGYLFKKKDPGKDAIDSLYIQDKILEPLCGLTKEHLRNQEFIEYSHEANEAVADTLEKKFKSTFIINPAQIKQVMQVAYKSQVLPPKTTDFCPKLLSGLIFSRCS